MFENNSRSKPTEDLLIALKSEVLGEAFFRSAYYAALFSNRRNKAKALWQLEIQTKKRIIKYFQVNNIEIPKLKWTVIKGSILGVFYPVVPWHFVLQEMLQETKYYLDVFYRLKERATEKDKVLFEYIVAHEVAIKQFAAIELANSDHNSLEPIEVLLND